MYQRSRPAILAEDFRLPAAPAMRFDRRIG
jgi:hypothetical protein